ncbi:MAG: ribosome biogenesis GTPase Der [Akkermansia sp.]
MSKIPTIAIVGRPNVGKSAIFNRMVGRKIAIVHDQPGVTRDRISAPGKMMDRACEVIDTGGIGAALTDGFETQVATEADIAMEMANLILFVLDCRDSLTPIDITIADHLRKAEVPVLLLFNKADNEQQELALGEFAGLGFTDSIFISAEHGRGFGELADLLDKNLEKLGAPIREEWEEEKRLNQVETPVAPSIRVAVVGKPNAGKSSLINAILQDKRTIVSSIAGTTRDAIDIPYTRNDQRYTLIDTAGMRPRSKRDSSVEVFSAMRSEKAIRRCDICLLVVDIAEGVSQQDRRIAGIIAEEKRPCIVVVNKFDLFHPTAPLKERLKEVEDHIRTELFFIAYAPIVTVSAIKAEGVDNIFREIDKVKKQAAKYPSTGQLNRFILKVMQANPPGINRAAKKRLRIYYATSAIDEKYNIIPVPTYLLFVNDKALLNDSYAQYLRNTFRQEYPCPGIPIIFSARARIRRD